MDRLGQQTPLARVAVRRPHRPPSRRLRRAPTVGRWSLLRRDPVAASPGTVSPGAASPIPASPTADSPDFVARQLLRRTGVVFRKTIERERFPMPWWRLVRELRTLEARGEVRGGRFVAGFDGEQYALPEAVTLLRAVRKRGRVAVEMPPGDPLHHRGLLAPESQTRTA